MDLSTRNISLARVLWNKISTPAASQIACGQISAMARHGETTLTVHQDHLTARMTGNEIEVLHSRHYAASLAKAGVTRIKLDQWADEKSAEYVLHGLISRTVSGIKAISSCDVQIVPSEMGIPVTWENKYDLAMHRSFGLSHPDLLKTIAIGSSIVGGISGALMLISDRLQSAVFGQMYWEDSPSFSMSMIRFVAGTALASLGGALVGAGSYFLTDLPLKFFSALNKRSFINQFAVLQTSAQLASHINSRIPRVEIAGYLGHDEAVSEDQSLTSHFGSFEPKITHQWVSGGKKIYGEPDYELAAMGINTRLMTERRSILFEIGKLDAALAEEIQPFVILD